MAAAAAAAQAAQAAADAAARAAAEAMAAAVQAQAGSPAGSVHSARSLPRAGPRSAAELLATPRRGGMMTRGEIDKVLRIQSLTACPPGGDPFVEDFYFREAQLRRGGPGAPPNAPQKLREGVGKPGGKRGPTKHVDLSGLGRLALSNVRAPRALMDLRAPEGAASPATAPDGGSEGDGAPLEDSAAVQVRILLESCEGALLDVDDVDRMLAARFGATAGSGGAGGAPSGVGGPGGPGNGGAGLVPRKPSRRPAGCGRTWRRGGGPFSTGSAATSSCRPRPARGPRRNTSSSGLSPAAVGASSWSASCGGCPLATRVPPRPCAARAATSGVSYLGARMRPRPTRPASSGPSCASWPRCRAPSWGSASQASAGGGRAESQGSRGAPGGAP